MNSVQRILSLLLLMWSLTSQAAGPGDWPAGLANECSTMRPDWIWCEDFERDRSADYFEGSADRQTSAGLVGSIGAAFHFAQYAQSAGGILVAFGRTPDAYFSPVDSGTQDYREIYWRMFVYVPSNWVGNGADKLSRATILSSSRWTTAMLAHVWSGSDPGSGAELLYIDPASGTDTAGNEITTGYNDFNNLRWLGARPGNFPVFSPENFGVWHCVEAHVKLNSVGNSDGVFQLFINDQIEAEHTSLNWVGAYAGYGINAVFFENYWNNGSPVSQTRYFDNLVISTQPIGCEGTKVQPMPPGNLQVEATT